MTRTIKGLLVIGAMTGVAYACDKSPADARNQAAEAQQEADKTAVEAQSAANKQITNSVTEAQKDIRKAEDDAREKAAKAQASANDKIREANRDIGAKHSELRQWGEKQIDDVNHLIDNVKVKAQTAAPKAQADFNSAIRDVELRRDALRTEVASLDERADTAGDRAKDSINTRIGQLKDRIQQIERTL